MNAIELLWEYRAAFLGGMQVTAQLVLGALVIGTVIGVALEWLCQTAGVLVRRIVDSLSFLISAVPALVLLFWLFYPAQSILGVFVSPFMTALAALSLMCAMGVYRIVSDATKNLPQQYIATAKVSGLSPLQTARYIQAPLLLRASIPRWIDLQVIILQTSVFASLISVEEIFRMAQRVNSVIYQPVLIYTAMAVVFLMTAGPLIIIAQILRRRFERDFSER